MIYLQNILQEGHKAVKSVACVFSASLLLAASAQLSIPFYPVPFTLQTITVLFLAYILGARLAAMSVVLYLLEGACGLPVFAGFSGGARILLGSPTCGYLWGFIGSAYCAGILYKKFPSRKFVHLVCIGLVSELPTFVCGYICLAYLTGWYHAWMLGVVPFIASTLLKNFLLAAFIRKS